MQKIATLRTDCFASRRQQIRQRSDAVKNLFPKSFADFVFIDGCHSFRGVTSDLLNYTHRVRKGVLVICHDIKQSPVFRAVKLFCGERGIDFNYGRAKSAWFFVKDGYDVEEQYGKFDREMYVKVEAKDNSDKT